MRAISHTYNSLLLTCIPMMKDRSYLHVLVAGGIALTALISAAAYMMTVEDPTYRTAVAIGEGGAGIALSYLLVVLYRQQREVQERQLDITEKRHKPDLQCKLNDAELNKKDGRAKFTVSNYGGGPAKDINLRLDVNIPTTPEVVSYAWTPENGGRNHNGENYISAESTSVPFWIDTTQQLSSRPSSVSKIRRWAYRKIHTTDRILLKIQWKLEYQDRFGNKEEEPASRSYSVHISDGYDVWDQMKWQLNRAEWFGLQQEGRVKIRQELSEVGYGGHSDLNKK